MNKTSVTELIPVNGRKSFNRRATVIELDGSHYLQSYETIVGSVDKKGNAHRYWSGKSHTTSCHIGSFLDQFSNTAKTTNEFYALECEAAPELTIRI